MIHSSQVPVELFKAKAAGVVVVDLVDGVLKHLPCLLGILGVEIHPMLERLDLEVPLPLSAHRWRTRAGRVLGFQERDMDSAKG